MEYSILASLAQQTGSIYPCSPAVQCCSICGCLPCKAINVFILYNTIQLPDWTSLFRRCEEWKYWWTEVLWFCVPQTHDGSGIYSLISSFAKITHSHQRQCIHVSAPGWLLVSARGFRSSSDTVSERKQGAEIEGLKQRLENITTFALLQLAGLVPFVAAGGTNIDPLPSVQYFYCSKISFLVIKYKYTYCAVVHFWGT